MGTLTGSINSTIMSTGPTLFVYFSSDKTVTYQGFRADYEITTGKEAFLLIPWQTFPHLPVFLICTFRFVLWYSGFRWICCSLQWPKFCSALWLQRGMWMDHSATYCGQLHNSVLLQLWSGFRGLVKSILYVCNFAECPCFLQFGRWTLNVVSSEQMEQQEICWLPTPEILSLIL